ncbi:MAG: GNAT family N-acetyltransferase [Halobaculum sp.]
MPGAIFLRGDELTLRPVEPGDSEFLNRNRNDPRVREWLPRARPQQRVETESRIEGDEDEKGGVTLLACRDGDPVGVVSLFAVSNDSGRATVSAWIDPEYHGDGYGTEATELLVEYAFTERRLHKLVAGALADNDPSRAVLESVGFREEGRQRDHYFVDGEYRDRVVYGLLKGEWQGDREEPASAES